MTIEEVRKSYEKGIQSCETNFVNNMWAVLRRDGMDGYVMRVKDGKRGIFRIHSHTRAVLFYPYTKAGRISLNSSGIVWADNILNDFKGCEE